MALKDQTIEGDVMKCSIETTTIMHETTTIMHETATIMHETTTKMHEIRSKVVNVSKLPCNTYVIGPDFYLTPSCTCCVSFKKCERALYVYIRNKSAVEIKIERTLILYDCNYKNLHEESEAIFFLRKDEDLQLMSQEVENRLSFDTLDNDTLIIDLIIIIKETVGEKIKRFIRLADPDRKLREDFKTMLENPVHSDVSLQVGDERIPAHWSVLRSRSPYFKKMFDSNMKERVENSIVITDLSFYTLKKLVEFLYTAHFVEEHDIQELFDLYYASDKYEVMDMRTLCSEKIIHNATTENVCQILQLAHRHNDKDLKMEALDFIQLHSDAVFQTEGWKKFRASEPLAGELFSFFCVKKK